MRHLAALRLAGGDVVIDGLRASLSGPAEAVKVAKTHAGRIKRERQLLREKPEEASFLLNVTMLALHGAGHEGEAGHEAYRALLPKLEVAYNALDNGEWRRRRKSLYAAIAPLATRISLAARYGEAWADTPLRGIELRDTLQAALAAERTITFEVEENTTNG